MKKDKVLILVEGAIMIALATALSFVKFIQFPWGGEVTLVSMLPICLYSIKRGPKAGMFVSFVYAIIRFIFGITLGHLLAYGLSPFALAASIIFDYFVAFSLLGLAGLFSNLFKKVISNKVMDFIFTVVILGFVVTMILVFEKSFSSVIFILLTVLTVIVTALLVKFYEKNPDITDKSNIIGIAIVCILRFLSHFVAGVLAYGSFAFELWKGFPAENIPLYSLAYNGGYMLPELVLVLVVAILLFKVPTFKRFVNTDQQM